MLNGFIEKSIDKFNNQEGNFCDKIINYPAIVLPAGDVTSVKADRTYLSWARAAKEASVKNAHSWVAFEETLYDGLDIGLVAIPPAQPVAVVAPAAVHPGMRGRFSNIAAKCKLSPAYTKDIGIDLQIEATNTPFVPQDGKPTMDMTHHVGHPFFRYPKGQYQAANIYKNSADGKGYVFYGVAVNATYTDNAALPAAGVSVIWGFKLAYLYQGVEVGTMSDAVTITVTGV